MDDVATENYFFRWFNNKKLVEPEILLAAWKTTTEDISKLIPYLIANKFINSELFAIECANDFSLPFFDLGTYDSTCFQSNLISESFIKQHCIFPLLNKKQNLFLAIALPHKQSLLNEIKFSLNLNCQFFIVDHEKLQQQIEATIQNKNARFLNQLPNTNLHTFENYHEEENNKLPNDFSSPVIKFIDNTIHIAIVKKASDIHFEPYEQTYRIRFRIDGLLFEFASPPINYAKQITTRLKIMAKLDISERRIPQDGRFEFTTEDKQRFDFRVNTCPTVDGEKIVLRILDTHHALIGIDQLGFLPKQQEIFLNHIQQSQGLILVTGPTGSGKTITLYSALQLLNIHTTNICSVEEPVEIHLSGINQVNINNKAGLNFATVLRAFLRQDPDVIMVGEMRDLETAEIAIRAAQTGHLVFSTLHTNSACESITRLINFGLSAYNIGTSISLIIAQRLVRKLCDYCKKHTTLPNDILQKWNLSQCDNIYSPVGCEYCHEGYSGRIGIFELLPMTEHISQLIFNGINSLELLTQAKCAGMYTLFESGVEKVKLGLTSLMELNRIVGE